MFEDVNKKMAEQKAEELDKRILTESVDESQDEDCPFTDEELDEIIDGDSIDDATMEKLMSHIDDKTENIDDVEIDELLNEDDDDLGVGDE